VENLDVKEIGKAEAQMTFLFNIVTEVYMN
jgi:hypothetical protein